MDLSRKAAVELVDLFIALAGLPAVLSTFKAIRMHCLLGALGRVEREQDRSMRRFLPLLFGVIVTPLSATARHEIVVAHGVDEGAMNLPVSRGRVDSGSTEQIYLMLKDGGSFSAPIPITNRFTCELDGKKWVETLIKGADGRRKAFWCVAGMKQRDLHGANALNQK